ncbi:mevalonate kinase family protein [Patulibacter minatonensis]|uniref:mevalonate kinase family protein n=1 Tax=Patulibacter minatonensis TaxID=298163 RepID=UPI00047A60DD|nr:hypothetical protein [Patulibacter minatonensis]
MSGPTTFEVPARAAFAGNPSDGFGGAVVATLVPSLSATASFRADEPADATPIVVATLATFDERFGTRSHGRVTWATTIPVSIGLAGSSAIVIATLRALAEHHGIDVEPLDLAHLALAVEVSGMGLAAGLQDRITQAFATTMFMDFRADLHTPVAAPVPEGAFVAYCQEAESSDVVHHRLRERWDAGDPALRDAVDELRLRAVEARDALLAGDRARLGRAMSASTELRLGLYDPAAAHRALFDAALGLGADANFTGSGGAVVCLPRDGRGDVAEQLRAQGYGIARL